MDTEQKARAYDEALKVARYIHDVTPSSSIAIAVCEQIFPELKESEDEKIKRILHSISSKISFHLRDIFTEEEFQCFDTWSNAWLEKQDGQKTWSKEDERLLNNMIIVIKDYYNKEDAQSLISWLKSLRPQTTWKPSDKQMEAIRIAAEVGTVNDSWAMKILKEMYNDLNHKE